MILKYLKKMPIEIINIHIMPYTYSFQPKELLIDIRSYYKDFSFIENYYYCLLNPKIFVNDLIFFCNTVYVIFTINYKFQSILRRHIYFTNKPNDKLNKFIIYIINCNNNRKIERFARFLWGLLTPLERTKFINEYIIDYE
jgi:hypothetical protein